MNGIAGDHPRSGLLSSSGNRVGHTLGGWLSGIAYGSLLTLLRSVVVILHPLETLRAINPRRLAGRDLPLGIWSLCGFVGLGSVSIFALAVGGSPGSMFNGAGGVLVSGFIFAALISAVARLNFWVSLHAVIVATVHASPVFLAGACGIALTAEMNWHGATSLLPWTVACGAAILVVHSLTAQYHTLRILGASLATGRG